MRHLRLLCAALLVTSPFAANANPITITFNEAGHPTGNLTGTTFYQSLGIDDFANAFAFGPDSRLPDDGHGITNTPGSVASILFASAVHDISFTWATAGGNDFYADIFDAANNLVASFFYDNNTGVSANGVANLAGSGIYRLEFHDGGATVAIDTLTYSVPEPGTLALLGIGLAGLGFARRGKKA